MENKLAVQNAIDFIAAIYSMEKKVMEDGKMDFMDLTYLFQLGPMIANPSSKGLFKNLPAALGGLSPQDVADLLTYASTKFAVKDNRTQQVISEAANILLHAYRLAKVLEKK